MMQTNNQWHKANLAQCDTLVELMEEFYVEEVLDFCPQRANRSAKELLSSDQFGAVLFLYLAGKVAGYVIATFGYSLEFGGRFVLIDELYIKPSARGMGEGKRALMEVEAWAKTLDIDVLRIEVNDHNKKALGIYTSVGFQHIERYILTK